MVLTEATHVKNSKEEHNGVGIVYYIIPVALKRNFSI